MNRRRRFPEHQFSEGLTALRFSASRRFNISSLTGGKVGSSDTAPGCVSYSWCIITRQFLQQASTTQIPAKDVRLCCMLLVPGCYPFRVGHGFCVVFLKTTVACFNWNVKKNPKQFRSCRFMSILAFGHANILAFCTGNFHLILKFCSKFILKEIQTLKVQ